MSMLRGTVMGFRTVRKEQRKENAAMQFINQPRHKPERGEERRREEKRGHTKRHNTTIPIEEHTTRLPHTSTRTLVTWHPPPTNSIPRPCASFQSLPFNPHAPNSAPFPLSSCIRSLVGLVYSPPPSHRAGVPIYPLLAQPVVLPFSSKRFELFINCQHTPPTSQTLPPHNNKQSNDIIKYMGPISHVHCIHRL